MVKISVIIPTYNNRRDIEKCLKSLKNQTFKDFEIIVVDGHSKDGTDKIAKKYVDNVVYENVGTRGGACNIGAKIAKGEILVFTDADAYFPKDWLEKIIQNFREKKDLATLGGNDIIDKNFNFLEKILFLFDLVRKVPKTQKEVANRIRGVNSAYRKNIFIKENGFNEKLRSIEETELHYRLLKKGYKLEFDPNIIVFHRRRRTLRSLVKQMFRNGIGRIDAIKVNKNLVSLMDILPIIGFVFFMVFIFMSFILKDSILLPTFLFFIFIYFFGKSLLVSINSKKYSWFPLIFCIVVIREISFSFGILWGILENFIKSKH